MRRENDSHHARPKQRPAQARVPLRQFHTGAGLGVRDELAACCFTRQYSFVCLGRTEAPSGAAAAAGRWLARRAPEVGKPTRSQAARCAAIAHRAVYMWVPRGFLRGTSVPDGLAITSLRITAAFWNPGELAEVSDQASALGERGEKWRRGYGVEVRGAAAGQLGAPDVISQHRAADIFRYTLPPSD